MNPLDPTDEERITRAEELEALAREKSRIHRRIAIWQLAAYVLIITISVIGWIRIENEADARCRAGEANRQALRDVIISIEMLGTNLVTGGESPTTSEQEKALKQFAEFREKQLALLDGPVCPDGG